MLLPSNNYSYNPGGRFYDAKYSDRRLAIQRGGTPIEAMYVLVRSSSLKLGMNFRERRF